MSRAVSLKTFLVSVLLTAAAHADPVAFHFSGTIDTSLYGDVRNGEFDFAPIPNGSLFSGCLSYDTDTAPTFTATSPGGGNAGYYPPTSSELTVETAAGTFSGIAASSVAVVSTGLNYNGLYAASQPMLFPEGWSDDSLSSYVSVLLRNPNGSTEPLSSLELPTNIDVESVSSHSVVIDLVTGVPYPGGITTRPIQVWGDIQAGAWSSGGCAVDTDGDGLLDPEDTCPNSVGLPVDETGCSVSDLVPCDGEYSSKGAYLAAVTTVARDFFERGLLTRDEFADLVKIAAQSNCGR